MATEPRSPFDRAVAALAGSTGWRRELCAAVAGALTVLTLAPFHAWYVLFLTLPVLAWLIDGRCARAPSRRSRVAGAAWDGWLFGFGFCLAGLSWVANSFLAEGDTFAWAWPFVVLVLPAGLALFFAAGAGLAALLWRPGLARLPALTLGLALAEMARGHVLTGLPWNTLGYALAANEAMMQGASVLGVYGLTFLAVAIGAAPAAVFEPGRTRPAFPVAGFGYTLAMLSLLGAGWAWGTLRLAEAPAAAVPGVALRIVQPHIPQAEKWQPDKAAAIFQTYLSLSDRGPAAVPSSLDRVTHLIWPESALPFLLDETDEALAAIAALLPERTTLLTGQARAGPVPSDGGTGRRAIYNSLFVMDGQARIAARYDKLHLVPFGEYLPFQATLEALGLQQLTRVRGGFTPGQGRRFVDAPGAPGFVPLICYEVIFPHAIRAEGTRPRWMLNVTNDAWFGDSLGPHQHFHQARVRAVEQGLPLIRSANTGISAVVDGYGRTVAMLPLGVRDALDAPLPAAISATLFSRHGRSIELLLAFTFFAAWLILRVRRRRV